MSQETARDTSRGRAYTTAAGMSFSDIPGQSALFARYLSDPTSLKAYYPNAVEDPLDTAQFVPTVVENYDTDRDELCEALYRSNAAFSAGANTLSNIERLRDDGVAAVVTGQQAGLFGGPLYTLYKALSAIRLAEELTATGLAAVPVFWMATEDHDFEEVSSTYFFDASGGIFESRYKPTQDTSDRPVGKIEIDETLSAVIEDLVASIAVTGFSSGVSGLLEGAWKAGNTFGRAFGETISSLLSPYGLVMLDPMDPALKRLAAPIYAKAIARSDEIVSGIRERDLELKQNGFHSQVLVDDNYFPLFWHDEDGARVALRKTSDGRYRARTRKEEFTRDELLSLANSDPGRFSPGVMLRPVVQDYLLPTLAYFGGGAEVSYFAQNSVVYKTLGRLVTPIFHRQSFTIVEQKAARSIRKLSLDYADAFKKPEAVTMDWASANMDLETAEVFSAAEDAVNTQLHKIDQHLGGIDPTLLDNLAKRRRKMIYHIAAIRKKTLLALSRKNGDAERRISDLFTNLMPNGHLQERSINALSFINKYGPDFIRSVYDAVDLTDKRHRFLEIPNE